MGVHVISAQSSRVLLPLLAERLAERSGDPFQSDVIVVPSVGVADYIIEALAALWGSSGIVANTKFWLPSQFNLNAAVEFELTRTLSNHKASQWLIFEHLVTEAQNGVNLVPGFLQAKKKFIFSQRVAQLFDRYVVHRPEMIADWNIGKNTDGFRELPKHLLWQPILWRALVEKAKKYDADQATSEVRPNSDDYVDLTTTRITLFGIESFSRTKIEILRQMSVSTDISLFHVSPYPPAVKAMRDTEVILSTLRHDAQLPYSFKNPLLRSWGQSSLESGALLSTVSSRIQYLESPSAKTVLSALHYSLGADEVGNGFVDSSQLQSGDGTVQIHLCHGAVRQVEVLRDALLHVLKADPTLRPRDILVLCKDLENFEPLLEPIMSARLGENGQALSVAVLDSLSATSTPVAIAINSLLSLFSNRCTMLEMLEVLSLEPIRGKFHFTDESLEAISRWVLNLNVKWGLNSTHRENWGIPRAYEHGTWKLAIDRLVVGILNQSIEVSEHFPGLSAFDDVSGSDIETIGHLHSFITAVSDFVRKTSKPLPIGEWGHLLKSLLDTFLDVSADQSMWLHEALSIVDAFLADSEIAPTAELTLAEFRDVVAVGLPSLRKASRKWQDVVRIGTPNRLRGVPARVIAVLGFDDDIFRSGGTIGDDILSLEPRLGEKDTRLDERLGMLSIIGSASDFFIVTCNGHDVNNNKPIPRPVSLIELQDAVAHAISMVPEHERLTIPVLISHSRQLADPINVGLVGDSEEKNVQQLPFRPWTFDQTALQIVERLSDSEARRNLVEKTRSNIVITPQEIQDSSSAVELSDLVDSVRRPIDVFVQSRLGVLLPREEDTPDDSLPLWPDTLKYAEIGREILTGIAQGTTLANLRKIQDLKGNLPFGELGVTTWDQIVSETTPLVSAAQNILDRKSTKVTIDVRLGEGVNGISDWVLAAQVQIHEDTLLFMNFARWNRRLRLAPWLQVAALTLHQPEVNWKVCIVARPVAVESKSEADQESSRCVIEEFVLRGSTPDERRASAEIILNFALTIRSRAQRVPIPMFERSSWIPDKSQSVRKGELTYDLERSSHQLVYGGFELADFQAEALIPEVDEFSEMNESRFDLYSNLLFQTWTKTTVLLSAAEPEKSKKKKSSSSQKPAQNVSSLVVNENEEGDV